MGRRATIRGASLVACLTLFASGLTALPVSAETPAEELPLVEQGITPADDPIDLPADPPPVTAKDRLPVLDLDGMDGLWPADVVEAKPGEPNPVSPQDVVDGLVPLPEEGGPNTDAFGTGPGGAEHVAVLYPTDVNDEAGTKLDIGLEPSAEGTGWTGAAGTSTVTLPADLSEESPIVVALPEGQIASALIGAKATGTLADGSVTYADVVPDTDLVARLLPEGFAEDLVLSAPPETPTFTWAIATSGVELALNDSGGADVLAGGQPVATIPAPVAYDASPDRTHSVAAVKLDQPEPSSYLLTVTLDPAYLAKATYPVLLDPSVTWAADRDTYVDSGSPGTSFETNTYVKVNSPRNTFLKFETAGKQRPDRLVYDATLWLWPTASGSVPGGIAAKRPDAGWPSPTTWNNQPGVFAQVHDSRSAPNPQGWWTWDLKSLYQHYIDETWIERGVRLSASDAKTFYASEQSGVPGADPALTLTYNDLPGSPVLDTPADAYTTQTDAITLRVKRKEGGNDYWPNDNNGDDVLVNVQVSTDASDFTGPELVYDGPFTDERTHTVPAGILLDGQTYYWRARSWDVCQEPDGMCSRTDGDGVTHDLAATGVRSFTVALRHFGDDPAWASWSHDLGGGMTGQVTLSNSNLYLDVPLDVLSTPLGRLSIGLSYNSQDGSNYGLGPGWDYSVGPSSSGRLLPRKLDPPPGGSDRSVKIRFRGGNVRSFPPLDGGDYGAEVAGTGRVSTNAAGEWIYLTPDRDRYVFDAAGALSSARVRDASEAATNGAKFTYTFSGTNLTRVTDPLGRTVDLTWGSPDVTLSTSADWTAQAWTLHTDGSGRLETIRTSVTNPATGSSQDETVRFVYGTTGAATGKVVEVRDGVVEDAGATGWRVAYATTGDPDDDAGPRVISITAPPGGNPSSSPTPWRFGSFAPYKGTAAAGACVADPRQGALTCDADPLNDGAYETQHQLTWSGRQIRITEPAAGPSGQTYRRLSTFTWDNHNNLLCSRAPAANAQQASCTGAGDLDSQGLSTTHAYADVAPWRRTATTHPAAATGGDRLQESLDYDHLSSFNGLWVEKYGNANLQGMPTGEEIWNDLDKDWNSGSPAGVPGNGDYWSVRLSGYLNLTSWGQAKKTKFRIYSDDGVNLTVGSNQLLGCFGTNTDESDYNCGTNSNVSKRLSPGMRPFSVELSELTGDAALKVQWDQGTGDWQTIPGFMLNTDLGLLTRRIFARVDAQGTTDLREETWRYLSDDDKARRLPVDHIMAELPAGGPESTTRYGYDDYGRVSTTTVAYGSPEAATTTTGYFDGDPAWLAGTQIVSCPTSLTDGSGAVTTFECSPAGDTTKATVTVDAVDLQPAQSRTTTTEYDSLGRVVRVTSPRGGTLTTTYDRAGRPLTSARLIATGVTATTTYAYDHAGHLRTETLPDPDDGGPLSSPVITHAWNWLDLETQLTDPRSKTWSTAHDPLGRVISRTSPLGAVTATAYRLGTSVNETVLTEPSGADTVTTLDVLGRPTSVRLESYDATTTAYDVFGQPTLVTDPAGVRTTHAYDGLGRLTSTIEFENTAQAATTTFAYDDRGLVTETNGPRSGSIDDRTQLVYDGEGRLTSVTQPGVTLPSSTTPVSVAVTYSDAGERVRVVQPMTTTTSVDRHWTYDTDGNLATQVIERAGVNKTTTYTTNLAGWVTQVADPRPVTVHQGFDNLGRRVCRHTSACTGSTAAAETYAFDAAGNMTQAKNPVAEINLLYDDDGRLAQTMLGAAVETTYSYSATTALLSSIADAAGTTSFTYNAAGQVATLDDPLTTGAVSTYGYDTAGRMSSRTDAQANLSWTRTYEPNTGRTDTQVIKNTATQGTLASFDLGYDVASNVTSKASTVFSNPSNGNWTYAYDAAGRMTQAVGPNAGGAQTTTTYGWDGASNRISVQVGAGTPVTTTYEDGSGFPVSASDGSTYITDDVGNLTEVDPPGTGNVRNYLFDAFNRMACSRQGANCTNSSGKITFALDALDRTYTRTKDGVTTTYTYQGAAEVPAKTVTGQTTTTYATTLGGAPIAQQTGSVTRFLLSDLHGDVVGLVDTTAANAGTVAYDPWGTPLGTTGTETSWFGYQGDATDPETKQVDMTTRWYEAGLGRFSSRDVVFGELEEPNTLNQFAYAGGSPVTHIDPTGMIFLRQLGGGGGGSGFRFPIIRWTRPPSTASSYRPATSYQPSSSYNTGRSGTSRAVTTPRTPGARPAPSTSVAPNRINSARVLIRAGEERGAYHNFPGTFDRAVLDRGSRTVMRDYFAKPRPHLTNDSIHYRLPGSINGRPGVFEIYTRPSVTGATEVIQHRFFRPFDPQLSL